MSNRKIHQKSESVESRGRRLKLNVPRGALARSRARKTRTSETVSGDHRASWESVKDDMRHECRYGDCAGAAPEAPRSASSPPPRTWRRLLCNSHSRRQVPTTSPGKQIDISALFSAGISSLNGKVLRRLQRRFPDLGARIAEMQLYLTAPTLRGNRLAAERAEQQLEVALTPTSSITETTDQRQEGGEKRRGRIKGRVAKWMAGVRRIVARACAGARRGYR